MAQRPFDPFSPHDAVPDKPPAANTTPAKRSRKKTAAKKTTTRKAATRRKAVTAKTVKAAAKTTPMKRGRANA